MRHYEYIIIGGGMTGDAAVSGIRESGAKGEIAMFTAERYLPYDRPPLTKGLWKDTEAKEIWRHTKQWDDVDIHVGSHIVSVDARNQTIRAKNGDEYQYEKLLLATGGAPNRLPMDDPEVIYFRTFDDYLELRKRAAAGGRFAVIGGGFIGSEIAAALALNQCEVVLLFPETGLGGRMFPESLATFLNEYYREKGVEVLPGQRVQSLVSQGSQWQLTTQVGTQRTVDTVVAGLGLKPQIELAKQARLVLQNGIEVNSLLQTSDPRIYAAGDVAAFVQPALNRRIRVEHEDNANHMGRQAGFSMAGQKVAYGHLPMFYSDLFDLGYEAVGEGHSDLETVEHWEEPYRKGTVYYLENRQVVGVVLWNVWEQVDAARNLIAQHQQLRPEQLKERLPA